MSTLPAGLIVSPMEPRDVDDVVGLLQLVDLRTIGQIETSPADLASWISPLGSDLGEHSLVVRNGPRVDGWLLVERTGPHVRMSVYSHPDWWGEANLDAWLLTQAHDRAVALAAASDDVDAVTIVTPEADHRIELLRGLGFDTVRRHRRMEIRFDRRSPDVPQATDVTLRNPDGESDLRAVHRVIVASFADELGRAPSTWEQFEAEHVTHEDFDPSLWFVAEAARPSLRTATDGELLGAIVARNDRLARSGWVALLAVREQARGHGVGLSLLSSTFRAFHDRGVGRVELGVDSDNIFGAQSLYERAGMREQAVLLRHRLDLPSPTKD